MKVSALDEYVYELEFSEDEIDACNHPGHCDDDCRMIYLCNKEECEKMNPDVLRAAIREYGAWDKEELEKKTPEELYIIAIWLACVDCRDTGEKIATIDGSWYMAYKE